MSNVTTIDNRAVAQQQAQAVTTQGMIFDFQTIQNMQRMAEMMAGAKVSVPQHLVNNPGDCLAVVMQAAQWQMNPFAVAQKTFIVQGKLGYEAQLVNAAVSSSNVLAGRINYEFFGPWERVLGKFNVVKRKNDKGKDYEFRVPAWSADDEIGCGVIVSATLRGEQSPRSLTVELVQARTRNSTLWAEDPRQQLSYLAVKKWARMHVPDVILGVYSPDEFAEQQERDMGPAEVVDDKPEAKPASRTASVKSKLAKRRQATEPDPKPVLDAIAAADTLDALEATVEQAKQLTGEGRKQAQQAYKARKQMLEAEVVELEPEVSEIVSKALAEIQSGDDDTVAEIQAWANDAELTELERKQVNDALAVRQAA